MTIKTPIRSGRLLAAICSFALALVLVPVARVGAATAAPSTVGSPILLSSTAEHVITRHGHLLPTTTRTYGWPVKPFDQQHPVRGFLNDPRIAGTSRTFHFGIDVVAPDGTAVYAVEAGSVQFHSGPAIIVHSGSHWMGYWHIVPAVRNGQYVRLHQLLGHIGKGWGHVHLCEYRNGLYLNPLRPGGIGPYEDTTSPTVEAVRLVAADHGRIALVASAHDMPSPGVPGAWADEPVTPALLQWRLFRNGRAVGGWRTAIDSRVQLLDSRLFGSVYAADTRQNHEGRPGRYWFYLDHAWLPNDGAYRLELLAADTAGNSADASTTFSVIDATVVA